MPYFANAYAVKVGEAGAYPHFFGDAPRLAKPNPFAGKAAPHLLYELSMADACLHGLPFARSEAIQLVHPFRYNGAPLAYHCRRDGVLVLGTDNVGSWADYDASNADPVDGWPYPNYPEPFARVPVVLEKVPSKEFIYGTLDMPALIVGPLVHDPNENPEAVVVEDVPNLVGALEELCPSASCRERIGRPTPMQLFAIVPNFPAPGLSLWGEYGEYVWVVFCVCPQCQTVLTYNITD